MEVRPAGLLVRSGKSHQWFSI